MSLRPLHARAGRDLVALDALESRLALDGTNLLHGNLPPGFFAPASVGVSAAEIDAFMNEADDPAASAPSTSPYAQTDEDMYGFTRAADELRLFGGPAERPRFIADDPVDGQSYADLGWSDSYANDWEAPKVDREIKQTSKTLPKSGKPQAPKSELVSDTERPAPEVAAEPADDSEVASAVNAAHVKADDLPRKPTWIDSPDKAGTDTVGRELSSLKPASIRLSFLKR